MPWPFRSGRARQPADAAGTGLDAADGAVLKAAQEWWRGRGAGFSAGLEGGANALLVTRGGAAHVVLAVHARRGKLTRVDVHDPTLRPLVDEMVRHFERSGQWSFNGVVRTLQAEGDL